MESKKTTNLLLLFIAFGIWIIVIRSFFTIPVNVIKGKIYVSGSVDVDNAIEIDNTISVSIDEVLGKDGKKYYFNNR